MTQLRPFMEDISSNNFCIYITGDYVLFCYGILYIILLILLVISVNYNLGYFGDKPIHNLYPKKDSAFECGFMPLLSFSKTPLLNSEDNHKRYVNINISSVLFATFLVILILSLIPLTMFISLMCYKEDFFPLLTETSNLNILDYNFFSLLNYGFHLLMCIFYKSDFILENFFICVNSNPWFGVFFILKYILFSIMTINLFVKIKESTNKSNLLVLIISAMRHFFILMRKDRKLLVEYLSLIWSYKGVFFIALVMIWTSVLISRVLYYNTMDTQIDSITWWNQFDMLFSTFLIISIAAYCLYKLFISKKLEKKSSSFLDLGEIISNLTFLNFFSCCVMYFLCIYYISPYYILIISSFLGLSFDIFINTAGIILKLNPALKSVHGIFKNFNITKIKLNTSFLYLHDKRLSGSVDKLVTEIRLPVSSLNKNAILKQKARPLTNIANMLVNRGVFKDTILYVKPCFIFSAVSGKNVFSISSNNGNTDYIHFVETHGGKKSEICDILNIYSKKNIFKIQNRNTIYYCIVKNKCIFNNYEEMKKSFHNKEILGIAKGIENLNIMKKAIKPFYNNNLEDSQNLLLFSLRNRVSMPACNELLSNIKPSNELLSNIKPSNELLSNIKPSNKGYSLDDLSVYNKSSSPFFNMLMGKTYDQDHMFGNEVNMNRFNNNIIVNMVHTNSYNIQNINTGNLSINEVNWGSGLYLDKNNKLIYIFSKKTLNVLNADHVEMDNLYYSTTKIVTKGANKDKNTLSYLPFKTNTYVEDKIALFTKVENEYIRSDLYGSIFKLDESVQSELENIYLPLKPSPSYGEVLKKWDLTVSISKEKPLYFRLKLGNSTKYVPTNYKIGIKRGPLILNSSAFDKAENISSLELEPVQPLALQLMADKYDSLDSIPRDLSYYDIEKHDLPANFVLKNYELIYKMDKQIKDVLENPRKEYKNLYYSYNHGNHKLMHENMYTDKPIMLYQKKLLENNTISYVENEFSGSIISLDSDIKNKLSNFWVQQKKSMPYKPFDSKFRYKGDYPIYTVGFYPEDDVNYVLTDASTKVHKVSLILSVNYQYAIYKDPSEIPRMQYPIPAPLEVEIPVDTDRPLKRRRTDGITNAENFETPSSSLSSPPSNIESLSDNPGSPRITNLFDENFGENMGDLYGATPVTSPRIMALTSDNLNRLANNTYLRSDTGAIEQTDNLANLTNIELGLPELYPNFEFDFGMYPPFEPDPNFEFDFGLDANLVFDPHNPLEMDTNNPLEMGPSLEPDLDQYLQYNPSVNTIINKVDITYRFFKDLKGNPKFALYDAEDPGCIRLKSLYPEDNWVIVQTKDNIYPERVLVCKDSAKIVDSFRPGLIRENRIICPWPNEDALAIIANENYSFTHSGLEIKPYYHEPGKKFIKLNIPDPYSDTVLNI